MGFPTDPHELQPSAGRRLRGDLAQSDPRPRAAIVAGPEATTLAEPAAAS